MKKIALILAFFSVSVAFIGCLKDKGFDNNEYGINDPDTQPPGVGFPFGVKDKNDFGLDVSGSAQLVNNLVYVNLESGKAASADVNIQLIDNTTALLAAYNTANGTTIQPLPTTIWNVVKALVIPAGGRNVQTPITISNTLALNSNIRYAVGLTISSVDGGYTIASNLKNLFIVFSVKNPYDGKYSLKGQFYHPSGAANFPLFSTNVEMHTSGPNTVKMYWPLAGAYASPIIFGGSLNYFGTQEPEFTVNTNNSISVQNVAVGAVTFYTMGIGFDNAGYNSRWVPATKTFYANWGYNLGAGGAFSPAASRMWIDTLVRTGPR